MKTVGSLHVTLPSEREIALTRIFTAPRHLVYRAYTEPDLVRRWAAGPPGWRFAVCEIDLRVGGAWRWVLEGPGGERMGLGGVYREIVPNERLVFTFKWDNGPSASLETLVTITFREHDGKTVMTFHQTPFLDVARRDSHVGGWTSAFEKAVAYADALARKGQAK